MTITMTMTMAIATSKSLDKTRAGSWTIPRRVKRVSSAGGRNEQHREAPRRVCLQIQYVGTQFSGWEKKPSTRTVQGEIQLAFEKCLQGIVAPGSNSAAETTGIRIQGASRTDTGVHALCQVAHVDIPRHFRIPAERLAGALNRLLPPDISITASVEAPSLEFDARLDALWRRYTYVIYFSRQPCVFLAAYTYRIYDTSIKALDLQGMQQSQAAQYVVGERDMAAFVKNSRHRHIRRADPKAQKSQSVRILSSEFEYREPFLLFHISSDHFKYAMIRLLLATIIRVGRGDLSLHEFKRIVDNGWHEKSLVTHALPPNGLFLTQVGYRSTLFDSEPTFVQEWLRLDSTFKTPV